MSIFKRQSRAFLLAMTMTAVWAVGATAQRNCLGDPTTNCVPTAPGEAMKVPISEPALKLDLPLFDLPYQIDAMNTVGHGFFSSYANPSMAQSLAVSTDIVSSFHFGMKALFDNWDLNVSIGLLDLKSYLYDLGLIFGCTYLLFYIPGGEGWVHEEFHRAVMTRHRVNSFNDMNTFPIGSEIVSVNSITDEDLIRFKAENPADFVRMQAAGMEGDLVLLDNLRRNSFFYDQQLRFFWLDLLVTMNSHMYVIASGDPTQVNSSVDDMNKKETTVLSRDFTGYDMTGWAYDLFRPDEPYGDRGVHPSGIGINRYRKTTDLTDKELNYLHAQRYWYIFNYISPMFFVNRINLGNTGLYGNFAFRHFLTSFGTDVLLKAFLKKDIYNMAFSFHNYLNYKHWFPAIEAELVDFPMSLWALNLYLSPRTILGTQPENQNFKTETPEFMGLIGCRVDFNISKHFLPYFDLTAKTNGWVAGNEFLEKNVSIQLGLSARF